MDFFFLLGPLCPREVASRLHPRADLTDARLCMCTHIHTHTHRYLYDRCTLEFALYEPASRRSACDGIVSVSTSNSGKTAGLKLALNIMNCLFVNYLYFTIHNLDKLEGHKTSTIFKNLHSFDIYLK